MTGKHTDMIVIGAGVFGLWTALAGLKLGLSVLICDAATPGAGASGGVIGALAPHMPERWNPKKQFQFEALLELRTAMHDLEAETGINTGYGQIGRLTPLINENLFNRAVERLDAAQLQWGDAAQMTLLPSDAHRDWVLPDKAPMGLMYDTLTARLDPAATCAALAKAITSRGGRILSNCRITGIEPGRVESTSGVFQAPHIVIAAGVSGFELIEPLVHEIPGRAVKGQAALLDVKAPDLPLIYGDSLYVIPHRTGGVAVGATSEGTFTEAHGTDDKLEDLIKRATELCPYLQGAPVIKRWSGLRPRANGRDPMVGAVPNTPGIYAALGGFKISFGLGEKLARCLVDEIMTGQSSLPLSFQVASHLSLADR